MESYLDTARQALGRGDVGKLTHLQALWNQVAWTQKDQLVGADCELDRGGNNLKINVYPSIKARSTDQQVSALLREFGNLVFLRRAPAEARRRWEKLLVLPTKEQVDACQARLREEHHSYEAFVQSFSTAADRLVALNFGNALRANRVPPIEAKSVDLRKWGPTEAYANLKRYHSAIPLVSAYAPLNILKSYGDAFSGLVAHKLDKVSEKSTRELLSKLVLEIAAVAR